MKYDDTSPRYAVLHWRNPETQKEEEVLESFLSWLEKDYDSEFAKVYLESIKKLANEYLGRDMKKIKAGEQKLLEQWRKACK